MSQTIPNVLYIYCISGRLSTILDCGNRSLDGAGPVCLEQLWNVPGVREISEEYFLISRRPLTLHGELRTPFLPTSHFIGSESLAGN